jgi:hypothetical protein
LGLSAAAALLKLAKSILDKKDIFRFEAISIFTSVVAGYHHHNFQWGCLSCAPVPQFGLGKEGMQGHHP